MKTPLRQQRTKRGFTVVELLIVISIMAILMVMAFFGIRKYISTARETNAVNSLRQIGMANIQYSVEYNGEISVARVFDSSSQENKVERRPGTYGGVPFTGTSAFVSDSFWGRASSYIFPDVSHEQQGTMRTEILRRLDSTLTSKDAKTMAGTFQQKTRIYEDGSGLPVPFAFNSNLAPWNRAISMTEVSNPGNTAYMTFGWFRFTTTDFATYYDMPNNKPSGNRPSNRVDYFSSKKAAVMFLDGHIELITPPLNESRILLE